MILKNAKETIQIFQKEEWKVPLPTRKTVMMDKKFDMETYATLMLYSNYGGDPFNPHDRYLYVNKFEDNRKEMKSILNITSRTLSNRVRKLETHNSKALILIEVMSGLVYKFKYKDKKKRQYVLINSNKLIRLIKYNKKHLVKVYLLMRYMCTDEENNKIEKQMDYDWIAEQVGLKDRECIGECIKLLKGEFVNVRKITKVETKKTKDGNWIKTPKTIHYYSLID